MNVPGGPSGSWGPAWPVVSPLDSKRLDLPFDRLYREYATSLADYSRAIGAADPDLIVAVSRKAPRLVQYINSRWQLPSINVDRCVTEKALPFLHDTLPRDARVVLTDDSIIHGSTFEGIRRELIRDISENVSPIVLARSRKAKASNVHGVRSSIALPPNRIHELIDLEVQAFGALGIPYDVDHPIAYLPMGDPDGTVALIDSRSATETTRAWQAAHGVRVWTFHPSADLAAEQTLASRQFGPLKVRVFIDGPRRAIRLVGIHAVAVSEEDLSNPGLFGESLESLDAAWRLCVGSVKNETEAGQRALAHSAHYLAGVELLARWMREQPWIVEDTAAPMELDLRLLFGPSVGASLSTLVSDAFADRPPARPAAKPPTSARRVPDVDTEVAAIATDERGAKVLRKVSEYIAHTSPRDGRDQVAAIFEAQRYIYDTETRPLDGPPEGRLDVGFPFPTIPQLLRLNSVPIRDDEFSLWLDIAVDGGTIVPKYGRSFSDPKAWVRTARFGERSDIKLKHWLHFFVTQCSHAYARYNRTRPSKAVLRNVVEDALAVVFRSIGERLSFELDAFLALRHGAEGVELVHEGIYRNPAVIDWALEGRLLLDAGRSRRSADEGSSRLIPNPDFAALYGPNPVDPTLLSLTDQLMQTYMAAASRLVSDNPEMVRLTLTACPTESDYLASLSAVLDEWLYGQEASASALAMLATGLARRQDGSDGSPSLFRGAIALSRRKLARAVSYRECFTERSRIREDLDSAFAAQGRYGFLETPWRNSVAVLIDDSPMARRDNEIHLLYGSAAAESVLSISDAVAEGDSAKVSEMIAEHRALLAEAAADGVSLASVADEALAALQSPSALDQFSAVASLIEWARGFVLETVARWRYPLESSAVAPVAADFAVLMWDIIGSSGQLELVPQGNAIDAANRIVADEVARRGGTGFDPGQDDGNAALLRTVADAIAVFLALSSSLTSHGLQVRASIVSTMGADKLNRNRASGKYGGRPYQLAARLLSAFKEGRNQEPMPTFNDARGRRIPFEEPRSSYLVVSAHALQVLDESEHRTVPAVLRQIGVIDRYRPRVANGLSLSAVAFVIAGTGRTS